MDFKNGYRIKINFMVFWLGVISFCDIKFMVQVIATANDIKDKQHHVPKYVVCNGLPLEFCWFGCCGSGNKTAN